MHDQPFDDHSVSYGGSIPGSPGSSLHSSNLLAHQSTADHAARDMRHARGGVPDSASGSVITSSSNYTEDEQ